MQVYANVSTTHHLHQEEARKPKAQLSNLERAPVLWDRDIPSQKRRSFKPQGGRWYFCPAPPVDPSLCGRLSLQGLAEL